jgi:hypothetical protein
VHANAKDAGHDSVDVRYTNLLRINCREGLHRLFSSCLRGCAAQPQNYRKSSSRMLRVVTGVGSCRRCTKATLTASTTPAHQSSSPTSSIYAASIRRTRPESEATSQTSLPAAYAPDSGLSKAWRMARAAGTSDPQLQLNLTGTRSRSTLTSACLDRPPDSRLLLSAFSHNDVLRKFNIHCFR